MYVQIVIQVVLLENVIKEIMLIIVHSVQVLLNFLIQIRHVLQQIYVDQEIKVSKLILFFNNKNFKFFN